jgi:hypothetical protein
MLGADGPDHGVDEISSEGELNWAGTSPASMSVLVGTTCLACREQ